MNCTTKTAALNINPIVAELLAETLADSSRWDRYGMMAKVFKRPGLVIDLNTAGRVLFVLKGCACKIDTTADLVADMDNVEALFSYVERGGFFPFMQKMETNNDR